MTIQRQGGQRAILGKGANVAAQMALNFGQGRDDLTGSCDVPDPKAGHAVAF